ncbi:hypothetical protein HLRTI_002274 [Halorhabdus tiamatea SARL4B]|uniref:Uncharacterized protein n=1 Tax=Halorhabdus tiamatea SARL4B TaxID=1033806 RepID=F7PFB7_9EURY|nr:hypothetical protein [Halorhabdus tiamatea]ERJ05747.1 hypothetical protein HLRTI_002274 [Halorhabdus tiamatea SARL4B]CCQ33929.1 conserved hypothetical protein [Halorhabdus tiamatea SARL4B]
MYERTYGTDWETLGKDEATERAFALGVAAVLGDPNPEEYERVLETTGRSYDRSLIELAYQEGKRKAAGRRDEVEASTAVWDELIEGDGEKTTVDAEDVPEGRDSLPDALGSIEMLERRLEDGLEREELPDFLRK